MARGIYSNSLNQGIRKRSSVGSAVKAENKAIANRPPGWSVGEARRVHRNANARSLGRGGRRAV